MTASCFGSQGVNRENILKIWGHWQISTKIVDACSLAAAICVISSTF
jgi:hypothetical protein